MCLHRLGFWSVPLSSGANVEAWFLSGTGQARGRFSVKRSSVSISPSEFGHAILPLGASISSSVKESQ